MAACWNLTHIDDVGKAVIGTHVIDTAEPALTLGVAVTVSQTLPTGPAVSTVTGMPHRPIDTLALDGKLMRQCQQFLPVQQYLPGLVDLVTFLIGATQQKTHGDGVGPGSAIRIKQIEVGEVRVQDRGIVGV